MNDIERLNNGVRTRYDGGGDEWANQHRKQLNSWNYMTDIDLFAGITVFAQNSAERLFVEYGIGRKPAHEHGAREFVIASLIDRKASLGWAMDPRNKIQTEIYCAMCRMLGVAQMEAPSFLVVIGGQQPPWAVHRVDIETAVICETAEQTIESVDDYKRVWIALGILDKWARLNKWLYGQMTSAATL